MSQIRLVNYWLIAVISIVIMACSNEPELIDGYSVSETGLHYKMCALGEGEKHPKKGDWLLLNVKYKTKEDSLFYHSKHHAWQGYFIEFKDNKSDKFLSYFKQMIEGDSMQFKVETTAFFKEIFGNEVPYFCKGDSAVKVELRLVSIMDAQEKELYTQSKLLEMNDYQHNEAEKVLNYAKTNFANFDTISGGIFFKSIKNTSDSMVQPGKSISIRYQGYYLDNELFDKAGYAKPIDFTYGSQEQLLPGMQMAIRGMRKGEIAKFILPSQLAFGEQGSSDGTIPPFCPLVYEVEIIDVK